MSRVFYTLAKTLSNLTVLALMVAVLAVAALFMQFIRAEDTHYQLGTLLAPFLWIAIPAMAVTAAVAVLFETLPVLRGGVGNVVFFFVWVTSLALSNQWNVDDFAGFFVIAHSMQDALRKVYPAYDNSLSLNIGDSAHITKRFVWTGVDWTAAIVLHRILWVLGALVVAVVASLFFRRFDPASGWSFKRTKKPLAATGRMETQWRLRFLSRAGHRRRGLPRFGGTNQQEPVLAVGGFRTASSTKRATLVVVRGGAWAFYRQWGLPYHAARQGVLIAAWMWPVLVWSQMGARESRFATQSLIFSSARTLHRQLPAVWVAGVMVAILTGGGYGCGC